MAGTLCGDRIGVNHADVLDRQALRKQRQSIAKQVGYIMDDITEVSGAEIDPATDPVQTMRKKDLLNRVAERAAVKRPEAKAAMEATLDVLGEAIAAGEDINLPGLGRIKVTRHKDAPNATVYFTRIRQPLPAAEPLADPDDNV